jgi:hypothetical protein
MVDGGRGGQGVERGIAPNAAHNNNTSLMDNDTENTRAGVITPDVSRVFIFAALESNRLGSSRDIPNLFPPPPNLIRRRAC